MQYWYYVYLVVVYHVGQSTVILTEINKVIAANES